MSASQPRSETWGYQATDASAASGSIGCSIQGFVQLYSFMIVFMWNGVGVSSLCFILSPIAWGTLTPPWLRRLHQIIAFYILRLVRFGVDDQNKYVPATLPAPQLAVWTVLTRYRAALVT
jgi:hypothetical protein